jgi:hypothetical protein
MRPTPPGGGPLRPKKSRHFAAGGQVVSFLLSVRGR